MTRANTDRSRTFLRMIFCAFLVSTQSGCAVLRALVTNESPLDEKSRAYGVMDLSKDSQDWVKLDPKKVSGEGNTADETATEVSDVAFQSKSSASIITLNSSCHSGEDDLTGYDELKELSRLLTLGFSDITLREEKQYEVNGIAALQTTVMGQLPEDPGQGNATRVPMMLRAVVLRRFRCTFDLVYITRPQYFYKNEEDFNRFVASLKLR